MCPPVKRGNKMAFTLPPLPYEKNALEPYISENTLNFHYGKHHQIYVDNLNKLIATDKTMEGKSLEEVITESSKDPSKTGIFNNGAQVWNHTFYWNSLKKGGGGLPQDTLLERLKEDFG